MEQKVFQFPLEIEEDAMQILVKELGITEINNITIQKLISSAIRVYVTLVPFADKDERITIKSRGRTYRIELPIVGK